MTPIPRVLAVAGTDPTGGAGIQADLKSIAANGGYGMAVATALVAQNTTAVFDIHVPPVKFLHSQLAAVSEDVAIDAVKVGMLFNTEVIRAVEQWLHSARPPTVVLDPVMIAASGGRLLDDDAIEALRGLLPAADLVTPNVPELAALLEGVPATTSVEVARQAAELSARYGVAVLAKGGHLEDRNAIDILIDPSASTPSVEIAVPRVRTRNTHGTGCSLSAALATLKPSANTWEDATRLAKDWLTTAIQHADRLQVGAGPGPISHLANLWPADTSRRDPDGGSIVLGWWEQVADTREKIDHSRFIRALVDGSLPRDAFTWYLAQDALYLRDYARVLADASRLAPTVSEQAFWASAAHGAIETELELHAKWIPADRMFGADPSECTTRYVDHLLATSARADYDVLVAAILPCFWIYQDVGTRLLEHAAGLTPYASWLQTYGDPSVAAVSDEARRIVAHRAAAAPTERRRRMSDAFRASVRHELAFFEAPMEQSAIRP